MTRPACIRGDGPFNDCLRVARPLSVWQAERDLDNLAPKTLQCQFHDRRQAWYGARAVVRGLPLRAREKAPVAVGQKGPMG